MLLGYHTNGFAHHDPESAFEVLAEIGYRAVALTIDHGVLDPREPNLGETARRLRRLAERLGLRLVVETGARYLLDPWTKHEPTLVSPEASRRAARVDFYKQAINVAAELQAECVSIWSGVVHDRAGHDEALDRLSGGLEPVLAAAERAGVIVAFEPEPGMLVDTLASYEQLKERLRDRGAALGCFRLTVDIGHLHCQGETPIADQLRRHAEELANVHIEDARSGVHEHLQFGDGEVDFPPILAALREIRYDGPVCVELSRHSHDAPAAARRAYEFLRGMLE